MAITNDGSHRLDSGSDAYSCTISDSVSTITDSQLQKGLDYIEEGDRYRDRGDFDKAGVKYEKAIKFCSSKAHDRLETLPLFKASKTSKESKKKSDSDRYIPTGFRARLHHAKEKVKQVLKTPPEASTSHQYFFPSTSPSSLPILASHPNTDSSSTSSTVSPCAPTPTLTTQSTAGTTPILSTEAVVSDAGVVPDVCSMVAAYKVANDKEQDIIVKKAYDIIKQFGESPVTFDTMQELVVLAGIQDRDILLRIITEILHISKEKHLLSGIPLQGLAVIFNSLSDEINLDSLHGAFVDILKHIQDYLVAIRTVNNNLQLLPLLVALNSLLDAMVRRGVSGLDRTSVYDTLRSRLDSLTSHSDVMVCFLALYAKQALAIIGNDESLPMNIFRRGKLAFMLVGELWKVVTNLDLSGAESAYQSIKELFDISIQDRWYIGLIFVDYLVEQQSWRQLEDFILHSKLQSDVCFQLGVVLRLEQIAVVQMDSVISNGALKLLIAQGRKPIPLVPEMVKDTLQRLGISNESTDITKDGTSIRLPVNASVSSQNDLRPVWDPAWHAAPKGVLLKAVQDRDQRNAIVDDLPDRFMKVGEAIQSSGSEVKGAVDQIGVDIQQLKSDARVIAASFPSQPILEDIQSALKTYYAPYLKILRVSGEELDLDTSYVNLAIVEASAQREGEKQGLKEQAVIFHRIPSFEAVQRTNMQSSIPLNDLFNKRKLRDGTEHVPKTVLVQGRAGIGKTTFCKKLVHAHQTGLWKDRFDIVLWLPLRQLRTFKARTLEDLLREKFFAQGLNQEGVALARALAIFAQEGRVLFILDGLDEIVTDTKCDDGIALRQLLKSLLGQQHVVITSRPSGLDRSLVPSIDLELETVGFSQQNVNDFLGKVLEPGAARTVQDFIRQTPLMQGLVNIPVQLDVICFSWDSLPTDGPMITITGLYQLMVRKLWCKDALRLKKTAEGMDLTQEQINQLAPEEIDELMTTELQHLGYLAFKGMNNHQIEFDEKTLLSAFRGLSEHRAIANVGLLPPQLLGMMKQTSFLHTADADLDPSKSDSQQAWYFLHLTFQEYFAATWIAQHLQVNQPHRSARIMTVDEATAFVQEHKYNPQYEIVWWMVAGLLEGEALEEFFGLLQGAPRDLIGGRHQQILASCLNEARARLDTAVVRKLDKELMKWLYFEIQISDYDDYTSILGSRTSFPEARLVESLDSLCPRKANLLHTLGARSTISESGLRAIFGAVKDESEDVRKSAVSAISDLTVLPESVVQSLIGAEDEGVRYAVESLLGTQPTLPDLAIHSLIGALKDEDQRVRESAASALGSSTLPEWALQGLTTAALRDDDGRVRSALLAIFGAGKESKSVRQSAASATRNQSILPASVMQSLVDALNDEDEGVRHAAALLLGTQPTLPDLAIHSLIGALKDEDQRVRKSAASALGSSTLPEWAIQSLNAAVISGDDDRVRESAASALGNQHMLPESAIHSLIGALIDEGEDVRFSAATALGKQSTLPDLAILSLIGVALKDEDQVVRYSAASALEKRSTLPQSAIQFLDGALQDEDRHVRERAATELGNQSTLPESVILSLIGALKDEDWSVRESAASALGKQTMLSDSAVQFLVVALKDENQVVRNSAAAALGKQNILPESAIQCLLGALKDEDWCVRQPAVSALGKQSKLPDSAIESLISGLKDKDQGVRLSAVSILRNQSILPESTIQSFVAALSDENLAVRYSGALALGKQSILPESAIQSLVGALKDEDRYVRNTAVVALGTQSTLSELAIESLAVELKNEDEDARWRAAEALAKQSTLPESAVQSLIDTLKDEDWCVRQSAVSAIGEQSTLSEWSIQSLIGALKDEDVRRSVTEILGKQCSSLCDAFPSLAEDELVCVYKYHLFHYSCSHVMSLQVQDNRLCFYTEQGLLRSDPIGSEKERIITAAFKVVQHEAGIYA
ncbi:hypothetical protein BGX28_007392 [Mortierella sp. GBA30]|nr:hypothetical protein BGX28_007392 [Mortierella sp. GBA30]